MVIQKLAEMAKQVIHIKLYLSLRIYYNYLIRNNYVYTHISNEELKRVYLKTNPRQIK